MRRVSVASNVVVLCWLLVCCAPAPDFRSAVYKYNSALEGTQYAQMRPPLGAPTPRAYANNDYRYIPGAMTIPKIEFPQDEFSQRAAVWLINEASEDCSPSGKLYHLSDLQVSHPSPVIIDYNLDSRNFFIPQISDAKLIVKSDLKLNDNDLRYVKRITIQITNVTEYHATADNLRAAFADIASPKRCRFAFAKRNGVYQVDSILAGDILVDLEVLEGASVSVGNAVKAKILRSISRPIGGHALFFAVSGHPAQVP